MKKTLVATAVAALFGASGLSAQTAAANASINIPQLLSITISGDAITFADPTFADYDIGYIGESSSGTAISTRANVVHDVTIEATSNLASTTGDTKPVSDLLWSIDGFSTETGLAASQVDVFTALPRGNASRGTVAYRMKLLESTDVPGAYSVSFLFTVMAN